MSLDDVAEPGHPSAGDNGWPSPVFTHLRNLTDATGVWEHARYSTPRQEHGYCTDDNARALVVVTRTDHRDDLSDLAATYLGFVLAARNPSGGFRNRRASDGTWTDAAGSDDSQGRAWWGLGVAARQGPQERIRKAAFDQFDTCSTFESPHLRANAYAALGSAEVVDEYPGFRPAIELLDRTSALIAGAARSAIPWPETRLTYDNARLPDALLAAGSALGDERRSSLGIRLLEYLIAGETNGEHFSFTPVGGREIGGHRLVFDQQPIEAWAMADACYRAWTVTGEPSWKRLALRAGAWLLGLNDTGAVLYDAETGATNDGLMADGVNENLGAESTLAGLGALQVSLMCRGKSS